MKKEELAKLLKEHLTLDLNFNRYTYGGSNQLTVKIMFDGEDICEAYVTIDPVDDEGYY